ncbi:MAG: hypothetical protein PHI55_11165 [Burkholderiaceae bacterium]|nr:hypothetical protein [Burkholderiaceae bacterium]
MKWTLPWAAALLLGCSPALNWRSVAFEDAALTVTLPCKPERATRTVELAGTPTELAMVGCDADGATFAVSTLALAQPERAGETLTHWRTAALARMGAARTLSEVPFTPHGTLPLPPSVRLVAQGQRPGGGEVTAQAVWFARTVGSQVRLYHAVVYTDTPRPAVADTFFAGLEMR